MIPPPTVAYNSQNYTTPLKSPPKWPITLRITLPPPVTCPPPQWPITPRITLPPPPVQPQWPITPRITLPPPVPRITLPPKLSPPTVAYNSQNYTTPHSHPPHSGL